MSKEPSDDVLRQCFVLHHSGPNPFYACIECSELVPGVRNELVEHWQKHNLQAAKPSKGTIGHVSDGPTSLAAAILNTAKPAEGSLPVVAIPDAITFLRDNNLAATDDWMLGWNDLRSIMADEIAKRDSEIARLTKSLVTAGFTNCGGELWKPPIGPSASPLLDELTTLRAQMEGVEKQLRESQSKYFDLRKLLDERPAVNQGLFETYQVWTGKVYSLDVLDAMDKMKGDDE